MDAKPWRIRVEKDGTRLVDVDAFLHRLVDVLLDLDRADTSVIPGAEQPDRLLTAEGREAARRESSLHLHPRGHVPVHAPPWSQDVAIQRARPGALARSLVQVEPDFT